jgi:hypothetical protein
VATGGAIAVATKTICSGSLVSWVCLCCLVCNVRGVMWKWRGFLMAVGEGEKKRGVCGLWIRTTGVRRKGHSSFARNFGLPSVPECPLKLGQNFELDKVDHEPVVGWEKPGNVTLLQ